MPILIRDPPYTSSAASLHVEPPGVQLVVRAHRRPEHVVGGLKREQRDRDVRLDERHRARVLLHGPPDAGRVLARDTDGVLEADGHAHERALRVARGRPAVRFMCGTHDEAQ